MPPAAMYCTLAALFAAHPHPSATIESPAVHEIAVSVATGALPSELRPFFEARSRSVGAAAVQSASTSKDRNAHSLPLDCAAEGMDPSACRADHRDADRVGCAARGGVARFGVDRGGQAGTARRSDRVLDQGCRQYSRCVEDVEGVCREPKFEGFSSCVVQSRRADQGGEPRELRHSGAGQGPGAHAVQVVQARSAVKTHRTADYTGLKCSNDCRQSRQ